MRNHAQPGFGEAKAPFSFPEMFDHSHKDAKKVRLGEAYRDRVSAIRLDPSGEIVASPGVNLLRRR